MAGDTLLGSEDFLYQVADFCMQDFIRAVKATAGDMRRYSRTRVKRCAPQMRRCSSGSTIF